MRKSCLWTGELMYNLVNTLTENSSLMEKYEGCGKVSDYSKHQLYFTPSYCAQWMRPQSRIYGEWKRKEILKLLFSIFES